MKISNALLSLMAVALIWSCGKDDDPAPPKNSAPVIKAQTFTAKENITDTDVIGTVLATDADKDLLAFSITANPDNLFKITTEGALRLAPGKKLDFATKSQHVLTVKVGDGEASASAEITVKVIKVDPVNQAPVVEDQGFSPKENISDNEIIGFVVASDADGDSLTFEITDDPSGLFEIESFGVLTLASGKNLDYETATEHVITVGVSDDTDTTMATVTITVENVIDNLFEDPTSFVTKWKTDADGQGITFGTNDGNDTPIDITVDWGDGTVEDITANDPSHVYATAGTYTVAIKVKGHFLFYMTEAASSLVGMEQWGSYQWPDLGYMFANCANMEYHATDVPDLSKATKLYHMFKNATAFNGDISKWDVSNVTSMYAMFNGATAFNGDLSGWDVSNVTDMGYMFSNATAFNGDISDWKVFNVIAMNGMFSGATSFNGAIGNWDLKKLKFTNNMFLGATAFDQDLGNWNIGSVINMKNMLDNSGMSVANMNATIIGWNNFVEQNNGNGPNNINLGVDNMTICGPDAYNAAVNLQQNHGWIYSGNFTTDAICN